MYNRHPSPPLPSPPLPAPPLPSPPLPSPPHPLSPTLPSPPSPPSNKFIVLSSLSKALVSYYEFSVLSMSVMGFQKKVWVGGVSSIQVFFWIFGIRLTLQSPLADNTVVCYLYSSDVTCPPSLPDTAQGNSAKLCLIILTCVAEVRLWWFQFVTSSFSVNLRRKTVFCTSYV